MNSFGVRLRHAWLLAAALALVLGLAACGGSDSTSSSTATTTTEAPAAAPVVPQAPAAAELPQAPSSSASAPIVPAPPAQPEMMAKPDTPAASTGEPLISRVVIANPAPGTESNNPGRDLGPLSTFQVRAIFENLVGFDAEAGELVPQLATSWSVEPDGISIRFLLRKGVKFHGDNGEMTSRDVVYTHAQITQEGSLHPHRTRLALANVEEVNDYEVVFRHSRANAEFFRMISEQVGSIQIQSANSAGVGPTTPPTLLAINRS